MKIKILKIFGLPVLALLNFTLAEAQQSTGSTPYQVSKGKWMISQDIFAIEHLSRRIKNYDDNNNLLYSEKTNGFYTGLSFSLPSWGNLNLGGFKTKRTDQNGNLYETQKNNNWAVGINPSIGYFLSDKVMLGARLNIYFSGDKTRYSDNEGYQENISKNTTLGIGPELRYYFGSLRKKQLFYAGIAPMIIYRIGNYDNILFSSISNITNKSSYKTRQPDFTGNLSIGSNWFIGKRWGFNGGVFGNFRTDTYKVRTYNNNILINSKSKTTTIEFGLEAGITYTL